MVQTNVLMKNLGQLDHLRHRIFNAAADQTPVQLHCKTRQQIDTQFCLPTHQSLGQSPDEGGNDYF